MRCELVASQAYNFKREVNYENYQREKPGRSQSVRDRRGESDYQVISQTLRDLDLVWELPG